MAGSQGREGLAEHIEVNTRVRPHLPEICPRNVQAAPSPPNQLPLARLLGAAQPNRQLRAGDAVEQMWRYPRKIKRRI